METSPYAIFRRSRLTPAELDQIEFSQIWSLIEEKRQLSATLDKRTSDLADALGSVIGRLDQHLRPELISLRRDVHNSRVRQAQKRLGNTLSILPCEVFSSAEAWITLAEQIARIEEDIAEAWKKDFLRSASRLRELFGHDAIERSIQLSGQQLYQDIQDFALSRGTSLRPAKTRGREASLVNYLYRAAFKPSPFGRFTEIGAFDPSQATGESSTVVGSVASVATLNRFLINWILAALPKVGDGLDLGDLVLSSTVRLGDKTIEYIGILRSSSLEGEPATERLISVQADYLLLSVVQQLSPGPVKGSLVIAELLRLGMDDTSAREFLQGLLRLGFIFYRPPADDHDRAYSMRIVEMLEDTRSETVATLREQVLVLIELERHFAEESAEGRALLLERAHGALDAIAQCATVAPPPLDILKSLIFEDTPTSDAPHAWDRAVVENSKPALQSLWRLSTALDPTQERRLGLYSFASPIFKGRQVVPFVEFFDKFARLSAKQQTEVLAGKHSEEVRRFRRERAVVVGRIRESIEASDGEAHIEPRAVDSAVEHIHWLMETESVTFRTQFASIDSTNREKRLVVNGVLTGYGVYMSRFGSFIPSRGEWSLTTALQDHVRRQRPSQVDLNAVLGFNFNLHPRVCSRVVDYPGARTIGADQAYRPADLNVRIDHDAQALRLHDPNTNTDIDLVPMNFMTPYGVPLLYRLLEHMSPSNRYHWNLWGDIQGGNKSSLTRTRPRLFVGNVVADRAAWVFSAQEFPELHALSRDDSNALERFDLWRTAMGLPQECFVLCQTSDEGDVFAGRGRQADLRPSDYTFIRRASVHKPMYVNFRNPYLARSFAKSALSRPGVIVTIRECLPGSNDYDGSTGATAAEEYFLEFIK